MMIHFDDEENYGFMDEFPEPNIIRRFLCKMGLHTWWIRQGMGLQKEMYSISEEDNDYDESGVEFYALLKTMPSNTMINSSFCKSCGLIRWVEVNGKKYNVQSGKVK